MTTRVILADDHEILRSGLRSLLDRRDDVEVVAEVDNGRDAVARVAELSPDMVIMDIAMPDLNGIDATRQIRSDAPGVKVIALSMHTDGRFVTGMFQAGASGYVVKSAALEELLDAIDAVRAGRYFTSPRITDRVVEDYVRQQSLFGGSRPGSPLSAREREVLQLIAEGLSTKEAAERLTISVNTVDSHRRRIMAKLGLHTVADLTKYAIREGLTSLED